MARKKLTRAAKDLTALTRHLIRRHELSERAAFLRVRHDPRLDSRNRLDPRSFCVVASDTPTVIFCAAAIEDLPVGYRMGVLYHEVVHLMFDELDGDESEVRVDKICLELAPELRYQYRDLAYHQPGGEYVIARSLQYVDWLVASCSF